MITITSKNTSAEIILKKYVQICLLLGRLKIPYAINVLQVPGNIHEDFLNFITDLTTKDDF